MIWNKTGNVGPLARPLRGQGSKMWLYGDSGAIWPGINCTQGKEWFNLLAARLGIEGRPTTFAVGGSDAIGVAAHLLNGAVGNLGLPAAVAGAKWDGTRRGMCFLHLGLNDASGLTTRVGGNNTSPTDADHQVGMVGALRTCLAVLSQASRVEVEAAARTGAWTANPATNFSGGNAYYTTTPGAKVDFAVNFPATGPFAGKVWVILHSLDPAGFTVPIVEIRVDGALVKTVAQQTLRMRRQTTSGTTSVNYAPCAIEVDAAGGARTVTVTHAGANGSTMSVDCVIVPAASPPPIFMPKEWTPLAYGTGDVNVLMANYAILWPLYQAVLAEFPNAKTTNYTLAASGLGNDQLHPNDRGMRQMADDWGPAIQAHLAAYDGDNLYNSLSVPVWPASSNLAGVGAWGVASATNYVVEQDTVLYIFGGAVTDISIDDTTTGLTTGTFIIPKGHRIRATYTVAPNFSMFDLSGIGRA